MIIFLATSVMSYDPLKVNMQTPTAEVITRTPLIEPQNLFLKIRTLECPD